MKFSVIIPIYNAEMYLNKCILSVVNQSVPFEKYINLILINDGSDDASEEICMKFKQKFPNNIKYQRIENSGPAKARNIGISMCPNDTEYITFLDSDDKLDFNVFEKAQSYFKINPRINIAVIPVHFFGKEKGSIKLNSRFSENDTVINIFEKYNYPQYYIGGVFINQKLLNEEFYTFNEELDFWEDALFINMLILKEARYGIIKGTKYWYRKRLNEDSIVDNSWFNKYRYTHLINHGYSKLIDFSHATYDELIPYVKYLIIYHLKLFVFQKNSTKLLHTLSINEREEFISSVITLLNKIDDKFILEQNTRTLHKEFLLSLKYNKKIDLTSKTIDNVNFENSIRFSNIRIKGINVIITGCLENDNYLFNSSDKVFIKSFNKTYSARSVKIEKKTSIWGIVVRENNQTGFEIEFPIWLLISLCFGIKTNEKEIFVKKINIFWIIKSKFFN